MNWQVIGIGFIIYHLLQQAGTFISNQISVGKPRLKFGAISWNGIQATLYLPVTNNNPAGLPIDSFQGQVLYGQFPLSNVYLDKPVTIQANGTTELQFNITIDTSQFSGSIVDLINSGQLLQSLRIKGNITSKGVVIPIDRTLQLLTYE